MNLLIADFQKRTGIAVKVKAGEGPEIANEIAEEGSSSPADVYFTENSPELQLLSEKDLLTPVDAKTLAEIPSQFNSPKGDWLGVLARENVLAYNTAMVKPGQLPKSIMDLAGPAYKGKIGIAPSDADFLPLVSAVAALKEKRRRWTGSKASKKTRRSSTTTKASRRLSSAAASAPESSTTTIGRGCNRRPAGTTTAPSITSPPATSAPWSTFRARRS